MLDSESLWPVSGKAASALDLIAVFIAFQGWCFVLLIGPTLGIAALPLAYFAAPQLHVSFPVAVIILLVSLVLMLALGSLLLWCARGVAERRPLSTAVTAVFFGCVAASQILTFVATIVVASFQTSANAANKIELAQVIQVACSAIPIGILSLLSSILLSVELIQQLRGKRAL